MEKPKRVIGDKIIFFDGVCNLCNRSLRFIIKRDKKCLFNFATLQSEFAEKSFKSSNEKYRTIDSVVYREGNIYYDRSDAILKILDTLGGVWKIFAVFKIIPKSWRDNLYDFIAKRRYRWFGRRDKCIIPSPELRLRFLD